MSTKFCLFYAMCLHRTIPDEKNSSEEALQRWRKACWLVKNRYPTGNGATGKKKKMIFWSKPKGERGFCEGCLFALCCCWICDPFQTLSSSYKIIFFPVRNGGKRKRGRKEKGQVAVSKPPPPKQDKKEVEEVSVLPAVRVGHQMIPNGEERKRGRCLRSITGDKLMKLRSQEVGMPRSFPSQLDYFLSTSVFSNPKHSNSRAFELSSCNPLLSMLNFAETH
ncbi:unnamed protein product [Fraxinus pennsylvanica]|uniref:Uncharacterized protein n=1 Tax=Fraxinus pennsylvanica TaxID=56036 RepID=A0AAD2EGR7_9LAMI|nr:unnamed protein product [Fraxinus pennsylvanica]